MINPLWFRQYHITRVPILIIQDKGSSSSSAVTEIAGNLSLPAMLSHVAQSDDGWASQFTTMLLAKGEKS